jgi:cytochrome c
MASTNLENNKIFAAVLVAGIVAMLAGFLANKFVSPDELEEDAYPIEVADEPVAGVEVVEEVVEPIDDLIVAANMENGETLARACAACHSFDKGGPNKIGPNLWGIYNAPYANVDGYAYSDALIEAGGTWDVASLNAFLWKPKKHVPGTKMNYIGMKKPKDRADMVKYLQSLQSFQ